MKRHPMSYLVAALLAPYVLASPVLASPLTANPVARRVTDFQADPSAAGASSSNPGSYASLGPKTLFLTSYPTSTGQPGGELWVTEGTPASTRTLESHSARAVGKAGGLFYYLERVVRESRNTYDLWRTNGTTAGTFPLGRDVAFPDPNSFRSAAAGGTFFFTDSDANLWRTDGTPETTEKINSVRVVRKILSFQGQAVIFADGAIWISDGSSAGTRRLADHLENSANITAVVSGSHLYYLAEILNSRGLVDQLLVLRDPASAPEVLVRGRQLQPFFLKGDGQSGVYFIHEGAQPGWELWRLSGDTFQPSQLTRFEGQDPFPREGSDSWIWTDGRVTWFRAFTDNDRSDQELWRVEKGPGSQQRLFPSCAAPTCSFEASSLQRFGSQFVFRGRESSDTGNTDYLSDGTRSGTGPLQNLCSPSCTGGILNTFPVGDQLFLLSGNEPGRTRLWQSDGSRPGTRQRAVFQDEQGMAGRIDAGSATAFGWILSLYTPEQGVEPWVLAKDSGSLFLLRDIGTESPDAQPQRLISTGSDLVFATELTAPGTPLRRRPVLFRLGAEGPPQEQMELGPFENFELLSGGHRDFVARNLSTETWDLYALGSTPGENDFVVHLEGRPQDPVVWNGESYFLVESGNDRGLWATDGSAAGTRRIFDGEAQGIRRVSELRLGSGGLFFLAQHDGGRISLWFSEGVADGTRELAALGTGSFFDSRFPGLLSLPLENQRGTLFLSCIAFDNELWQVDLSTDEVRSLGKGGFCDDRKPTNELIEIGGNVVFSTSAQGVTASLWRLGAGAETLVEITSSFFPPKSLAPVRAVGGKALFPHFEPETGIELWASDGSPEGTAPLKNLRAGFASSDPRELTLADGRLFFSADDGVHGRELWVSDGTAAGTRLVHDLFPGAQASAPADLTLVEDRLYFTADDGLLGRELWLLPLGEGGLPCRASEEGLCLQANRFLVETRWRTRTGRTGAGTAMPLTSDSGYFWFFNSQNVELVTKVLDARDFNDHFWTFYGALSNVEYWLTVTDTETGLTRRYFNPLTQFASVGDTRSFGPRGASLAFSPDPFTPPPALAPEAAAYQVDPSTLTACAPSSERLCLLGGRFAAEVSWSDFQGVSGPGIAGELTSDTGSFWFFKETNIELIVKVLDGRHFNGNFWVFYGSLSNVDFDLKVTDTETGQIKVYRNRSRRFASVGDTRAF